MLNSQIKRGDLVSQHGEPFVVLRPDSGVMALIYPGNTIPGSDREVSTNGRWVWTETLEPRNRVPEDARTHRVETGGPGNWGTVGLYGGPASYAEALAAARKRHAMSPGSYIRVVLEEVTDVFGPAVES
jgi:hypothetical protein